MNTTHLSNLQMTYSKNSSQKISKSSMMIELNIKGHGQSKLWPHTTMQHIHHKKVRLLVLLVPTRTSVREIYHYYYLHCHRRHPHYLPPCHLQIRQYHPIQLHHHQLMHQSWEVATHKLVIDTIKEDAPLDYLTRWGYHIFIQLGKYLSPSQLKENYLKL